MIRRACRDVVGPTSGPEQLEERRLLAALIHYPLNEGTGVDVRDAITTDAFGAQDRTVQGATWVPGHEGTALSFDGVDDSITGGDISLIIGGTSTVSFWIKTTAVGNNNPRLAPAVIGTGEGNNDKDIFWGFINGAGRIGLHVPGTVPTGGKDTVLSTTPINDGNWHHVAMTRDTGSGEIKIYVNGILNDTGLAHNGLRDAAFITDFGLVFGQNGARTNLNAQLDQIRVADHALAGTEVATEFDPTNTAPAAPTGLNAAYRGARALRLEWTPGSNNSSFYEVQYRRAGSSDAFITRQTNSTSFFITGLTPNTNYEFQVRAVNPTGPSAFSALATASTTAIAAPGTGNGLQAVYYDVDGDANPANNTGPIVARLDPNIAVDWGTGQPHPSIAPDNFTVVWTGQIQPQYSEPYTFFSRSDDGFFLWLTKDGVRTQLINDPTFHGTQAVPGLASIPIDLVAGQKYDIEVQMFEGGGGAAAFLAWQSPSQLYQNVPQSQLYAPALPAPTGVPAPVTATATNSFNINLTWGDTSGEEIGFIIERSPTGAAGSFVEHARVAGTVYNDVVYPGQTFHYRVRSFNLAGSSAPSASANATTPTITVEPGLFGAYYASPGTGGSPPIVEPPVNYRVDPKIEFPLGGAAPGVPGIPADDFQIRWEGMITIPTTGTYTFHPGTDDGVRLWINGNFAVNQWVERGLTYNPSPAYAFTANQKVPVVMEMYENGGDANAFLRWSATDAGGTQLFPMEPAPVNNWPVVPTSALTTQMSVPPAPTAVTASNVTANSLTVNWTDSALNESRYFVQRSNDGGATWVTLAETLPVSNTNGAPANGSFNATGLRPSTSYQFRLIARNRVGEGVAVGTLTTGAAPAGALTGSETVAAGDTNLTLEGTLDWAHWGQGGDANARNVKLTPGVMAWEAEDQTLWAGPPTDPDGDGRTWRIVDNAGGPVADGPITPASGGRAVVSDETATVETNAGWLVYNVSFTQPGTYRLFARSRHVDTDGDAALGNNDSAIVPTALNTAPGTTGFVTFDNAAQNADYRWARGPTYTVETPGTYTLAIGNREGGYMIDRFVMHRDGALSDAALNGIQSQGMARPGGPISQVTVVGTATPTAVNTPGKTFSWSDGTPIRSVSGTDDAIAVTGAGNGFRFTVPAINSVPRKVRVYVGVSGGTGRLTASLSDSSTPVYTETLTSAAGQAFAVYEFEYKSGLNNESLVVEWVAEGGATAILQAAAWQESAIPADPSNFRATGRSGNAIQLNWTDNSPNESGFEIYRSTSAGGPFTIIATTNPNVTAYRDNNLTLGTTYFYQIKAVNAAGPSGTVGPVSAQPKATGTGLRATIWDTSNFVEDPGNPNDPVVRTNLGLDVNLGGTNNDDGKPDPNIGGESFSIMWEGYLEPDFTETYSFLTASDDGVGIKIIDPDTGKAILDYEDLDLGRGIVAAGTFSEIAGIVPLTAGKRYPIILRMNEGGGGAGWRYGWTSASVPTEILPTVNLFQPDAASATIAPGDVFAAPLLDGTVSVNWVDRSFDETGFIIERSTSETSGFAPVGEVASRVTSYVDNTAAAGTTYYYRIITKGATANSAPSPVATVMAGAGNAADFSFNRNFDTSRFFTNARGTLPATLRLTNNLNDQNGSVYYKGAQDITNFETSFDIQVGPNNGADGFAFVIQRAGPTALGGGGGGLGYSGMLTSVAIKFDFYNNIDQTGLYVNGAMNDAGVDLRPSGIDLNGGAAGGQAYRVNLKYANGVLTQTMALASNPSNILFTQQYTVDIPTTIGGNAAYVGFTGATGGLNARMEVNRWTWGPQNEAVVITGTAAAETLLLRKNGNNIDLFLNETGTGTPFQVVPVGTPIQVLGMGGDDLLIIDQSGGDVVIPGGLNVDGGDGADRIRFIGATGDASLGSAATTVGGSTVNHVSFENQEISGVLIGLTLPANGAASVAGENGQLSVQTLTLPGTATFDVRKGSLTVTNGNATTVEDMIASVLNGGGGITTTSATDITGLTVGQGSGTDVVVKYGYNGDADQSGSLDLDDYFAIDLNFLSPPADPKYWEGDFNYDGVINLDDYFLIDFAFLGQGAPLSGGAAAAAEASAATVSTSSVVAESPAKKAAKRAASTSLFSRNRIQTRGRRSARGR